MSPVRTHVAEQGGWQVVTVTGVVDVATAPDVRARLHEVGLGGARVVVDLDGVELLDSFGLGVLVGAHKRAVTGGGRLVLVVTRERLRRLFAVTGLDAVLTLTGTLEDALADPAAPPG